MPRASTSPRCASRIARSWFERPTSPRVTVSSSASESSVGAVDAVGGAPDVSPEVDNEAAWIRVLGSIHAVYTRTFVAPYSGARARTRARTTSKSPVAAKAPPSAEQRNGCAGNRTCSRERRKRARIAVKRERKNQRAPRRHWRQGENCTECTDPMFQAPRGLTTRRKRAEIKCSLRSNSSVSLQSEPCQRALYETWFATRLRHEDRIVLMLGDQDE
jgi:hypothetical protein